MSDKVLLYRQMVNHLRLEISSGKLTPGERLPSIHDLSISCEVSHTTTEKALALLKAQGLIYSVQGKGFFVCVNNER